MTGAPKIAIIDPLGRHGGLHYYIEGLASGLAANGADVTVYVTEATGRTGDESYRLEVVFGALYGNDAWLVRGARYLFGLLKAIGLARHRGTEIISLHVFHYGLREIAAAWLTRIAGMKLLLTLHDIESFGHRRNQFGRRLTIAAASALVVHNRFSLSELQRLDGVPAKPAAIIPHGNYVGFFPILLERDEARARLGLDPRETVFLFFGNSRPEKGLDDLLNDLRSLRDVDGWRLLIAGRMKPAQRRAIAETIERLGLSSKVAIHAESVPDKEVPAYFRAADLVVLPYRRVYESGVAIMAMSLGRAVLASDLEPFVESLEGEDIGIIYPRNEPTGLVSALERAIGARANLDARGLRARRGVISSRNWDDIGKKTLELLERL